VYRTGETYQNDEMLVHLRQPDSSALAEHYVSLTYQALRDPQQRIIGILVFVLDVTPAARARQRLDALQAEALAAAEQLSQQAQDRERELHQMKADFVTLASHEFRTPLNTILTSTSLLEHYFGAADAPNHHKHVQRIKAAIHDLTSILNGFLHLNTLSAQPTAMVRAEVSLPALLEEVLDQLSPSLRPGQRVNYAPTGPAAGAVTLDDNMLRHILVNLLSNASKYSPEGSTIELRTEVSEATLRVTVQDEGIGIPAEDQEYLFNDFFRARNAAHIQGTGLGLYMVRRYVELMRGQLEFSSVLGQGSTFSVRLPLLAPSL
jgi:signal transduction histidine kinase